jgi:hypothetical protein
MRRTSLVLFFGTLLFGQSKQLAEDPGTRLVNYEVDGSVHSASVTYVDATGETKQKKIEVPYKDQFFAPYGAFVYIAAQKTVLKKIDNSYVNPREVIIDDGRQGTLHVMIRIGGVPFREAETEEAFGIAKASGRIER